MSDYTISETFCLPSLGKVYTPEIVPEVTLRSMNTLDEMRRLSPSEYQYKQMSDVLDSCIINGPEISSYDMCIGDYQFLLHRLRAVTYGSHVKLDTVCPICGFRNHDDLDIDSLPILKYTDDLMSYSTFELPVTKKIVKLKLQTPRLLDNINLRSKEMKEKASDKTQDFSLLVSLMLMIDSVDGKPVNEIALQQWVSTLPMKDTNTIFAYATKLNNAIGVNTDAEVVCSLCNNTYKVPFRPKGDFFRPDINV